MGASTVVVAGRFPLSGQRHEKGERMPANSETPVPWVMPGIPYPSSTGLGGSESPDTAAATAGPEVGRPTVSSVYVSSQLQEGRPTLPVMSGDTSGFSDDLPVHESVLVPPMSDVTGIGAGRVRGAGGR
jgi:hypothetical protein